MTGLSFDPANDAPDVEGKVIFITGGTAGLGAETALHLASKKLSHIYISGRNAKSATSISEKVQKTNPSTAITFISCDLTDLSSVQSAAQNFLAQESRLDILICNAGIMATPPCTSKDGYEIQFATNHLGNALLINSFLPVLRSTASASAFSKTTNTSIKPRIILLTSTGYLLHPLSGINFDTIRTPKKTSF
ncbi:Short-chain dehydrogenase/reductase SDR [Aspergillus affinis]|uniref:Short-chain dehydrogenase/reductase SDR n=1 Tax=Aspergillus affinis TaxID=1070780 RepID=UPI0022FF01FE|nr:Short-chain dehydrogenase/reductase SDR [Aspergillus affinis]KAI9045283.1 Short-chain dehydrogenase/reductase SDR [Aspergillus affinis]